MVLSIKRIIFATSQAILFRIRFLPRPDAALYSLIAKHWPLFLRPIIHSASIRDMQILKETMMECQTVNLLYSLRNPILLHFWRSLQQPLAILAIHKPLLINSIFSTPSGIQYSFTFGAAFSSLLRSWLYTKPCSSTYPSAISFSNASLLVPLYDQFHR